MFVIVLFDSLVFRIRFVLFLGVHIMLCLGFQLCDLISWCGCCCLVVSCVVCHLLFGFQMLVSNARLNVLRVAPGGN